MTDYTRYSLKAFGACIEAEGHTNTYSGPVWGTVARVDLSAQEDAEGRVWSPNYGNNETLAELFASAPRLKQERDELLGSVKSLLIIIRAQGFILGGPIDADEISARELIAKVEK